jgi:hypothetical protein
MELATAGGARLLHPLTPSSTFGGRFAVQVPMHSSVRGNGQPLIHRTIAEQAPLPAQAWSSVQQFWFIQFWQVVESCFHEKANPHAIAVSEPGGVAVMVHAASSKTPRKRLEPRTFTKRMASHNLEASDLASALSGSGLGELVHVGFADDLLEQLAIDSLRMHLVLVGSRAYVETNASCGCEVDHLAHAGADVAHPVRFSSHVNLACPRSPHAHPPA